MLLQVYQEESFWKVKKGIISQWYSEGIVKETDHIREIMQCYCWRECIFSSINSNLNHFLCHINICLSKVWIIIHSTRSFNTRRIVLANVFISKVWIILHVTRSFNTNRIVLADVFKENITIFSFLPRSETFQQQAIYSEIIDDNT